MSRFNISSVKLILLVSTFIILVNNQVFFSRLTERLDLFSLQGGGYVLTFYAFIIGLISLLLLIFGQKFLLKPLLIFLLIFSSVLSYFNQEVGVVFDVDMVRNIVENIKDHNQQEATELISFPLLKHIFLFGILPSLFVVWTKISDKPFFKELILRVGYGVGISMVVIALIMTNFKYTTYFSRENRDLRVYLTPLYVIDSLRRYVQSEQSKQKIPLNIIGADAVQQKPTKQRTIGVMVVGETARADHFSLNGYTRETNPRLKLEKLVNYQKASSCGTSTAFSVPCMFSFLDRSHYSPLKADRQSNSLDVLTSAGVKVIWIDNNSSCKGVCKRINNINLRQNPNPQSPYYSDGEMFDEVMIAKMDDAIKRIDGGQDILIVLHTLGSHGPKYYKRYPDSFSKFEPACKKATPQECTDQQNINAYDNTILYTDYFLSKIIAYLKSLHNHANSNANPKADTFMFYASDHGESLGEKGIYLHGLPYFLAPDAQTHIPMLSWFSGSYIKNHSLDFETMQQQQDAKTSHDKLSHSILGAFAVKTAIYKKSHDLLMHLPAPHDATTVAISTD